MRAPHAVQLSVMQARLREALVMSQQLAHQDLEAMER